MEPKFFKDDFADLKPISTLINQGKSADGSRVKMMIVVDVFRQETYHEVYIQEPTKRPEFVGKFYNLPSALQAFRVLVNS